MLLLLLACGPDAADSLDAGARPSASVDSLPLGARFMAETWGTDVTPEQARRFELVAGELQAREAELASVRADRVRTLARVIGQDPTSSTTAEETARAVADQDATILRGRAQSLCTLFDTYSPEQREMRRAAGRVVPALAEALPRSGTNTFDFAAPLLRRQARDVQLHSRRADGYWAPVAAAVAEAEPRLAELNPATDGWCREYLYTLAPVYEAWNAWHRQGVMDFGNWIVSLPAAERASFLDAGGLDAALRWSVGTPDAAAE